MACSHKIDDQNPKKPPTGNSSFQQKKLCWLWEKLYKDFKSKKTNKARINVLWLGKYNPFFVFHDSVFTIPKHNVKTKKNFFLNVNHGEKLCFTEFNTTRIYWNRSLVASGLLFLFTELNKFSKFNWHMLRKRLIIKLTENEKRLLPSATFTAKLELVLVLTQENVFRGFILKPTEIA